MTEPIRVLAISGTMGAGKTTVLGEVSDVLTAAGVRHAAVDLDALGIFHLPGRPADALELQNLASVWANFRKRGARRLVVAGAIASMAEREQIVQAVAATGIVVCRLRARLETMQQRIRTREPGMLRDVFVSRVTELESILDTARVEDFSVDNDGRAITDVAREVLVRAGWL